MNNISHIMDDTISDGMVMALSECLDGIAVKDIIQKLDALDVMNNIHEAVPAVISPPFTFGSSAHMRRFLHIPFRRVPFRSSWDIHVFSKPIDRGP